MIDLPVEECKAMERVVSHKRFASARYREVRVWLAAREYSKQRDEELREALREINLMAGVMDGSTADSGWAEIGRTAVGLARAALAENGDLVPDELGDRRPGA